MKTTVETIKTSLKNYFHNPRIFYSHKNPRIEGYFTPLNMYIEIRINKRNIIIDSTKYKKKELTNNYNLKKINRKVMQYFMNIADYELRSKCLIKEICQNV